MKLCFSAIFVALATSALNAADLPATLSAALPVFPENSPAEIELGQLLFFDPILSGSKSVSCATCHHPKFATSDGVSLGLGDGGIGLGPNRLVDPLNMPEQRVGRNSPALFNLGASEFTRFFHDGRLEADASRASGIRSPLEDAMAIGFTSVLSAQAMFPVLSPDEMAGHYSENDISKLVRLGMLSLPGGAWDQIAMRVAEIPEYRSMFDNVIGDNPIKFTDISNAIAAFIAFEWRADDAPFDRLLRHGEPLPAPAQRGMALFYGDAGCADCHSGLFQTDHEFHAIAMPQIGPGKAARFESHNRDLGRMRVTGDLADAYRFRTPSLRNIALTGPYGHSGAYARLEDVVRHHLDPVASLMQYSPDLAVLPDLAGAEDWRIMQNMAELEPISAANELSPSNLSDAEVGDILAFLDSLTDPQSLTGRLGIPAQVPSGLTVDR